MNNNDDLEDYAKTLLCGVCLVGAFIVSIPIVIILHEEYLKHSPEHQAAKERARTPHVIREVDGCKVYTFESERGRQIYFTKCVDSSNVKTYTPYGKRGNNEDVVETFTKEN